MSKTKVPEIPDLAKRIKTARIDILKLSQRQFSNRIGVSQSNVSRWELGTLAPEPEYLLALSKLLQGRLEGLYFLEAAGVPNAFLDGTADYSDKALPTEFWTAVAADQRREVLYIPLLRDPAAVGTARAIDDGEIETYIPLNRSMAPKLSSLVAMRVVGESMAPLIPDGSIVVLDATQRDPKKLVDRIVVARFDEEVTIRHLRRDRNTYLLLPQNAPRFSVEVLQPEHGWSIVGTVVTWMGFPAPGRK